MITPLHIACGGVFYALSPRKGLFYESKPANYFGILPKKGSANPVRCSENALTNEAIAEEYGF